MSKTQEVNQKPSKAANKDSLIRSGTLIYKDSIIGKRFITGHNAIIRENNTIGNDVIVGTNSYLGPGNIIGNNVRIHTNCFLEGVVLEDNVIISPHVVFTNDPYPPCKICAERVRGARVGKNTVIGANATILPGIKIGENVLVGAGSVVTKNITDAVVVVGNPARILKKRSEITHTHHNK